MRIETLSGIKTLSLITKDDKVAKVAVDMGSPELKPEKIPVRHSGDAVIAYPLQVEDEVYGITCVSMGNPHCVVFRNVIDTLNLQTLGPLFENHPFFPERVNAEFVQILDERTIKMRVWERGSGETLACGTGACAAVVAATLNGYLPKGKDIRVILKGGDVTVNYSDETVILTGDAEIVFQGTVLI
jgi:diaminopimelate epimerase